MDKSTKAKRNALSAIIPNVIYNEEPTDKSETKKDEPKPQREKVLRKTYSLRPLIVTAIEKYAYDNDMDYSDVITQALKNYIPKKYFTKDNGN